MEGKVSTLNSIRPRSGRMCGLLFRQSGCIQNTFQFMRFLKQKNTEALLAQFIHFHSHEHVRKVSDALKNKNCFHKKS